MRHTFTIPVPVEDTVAGTVTFSITSTERLFRRSSRQTFRQLTEWTKRVAAEEMTTLWLKLDTSNTALASEYYNTLSTATENGVVIDVEITVILNEGWRCSIADDWISSVLHVIVHHSVAPSDENTLDLSTTRAQQAERYSPDTILCGGIVADPAPYRAYRETPVTGEEPEEREEA